MKKLILILLLVATAITHAQRASPSASLLRPKGILFFGSVKTSAIVWGGKRSITFDHTKVSDTGQTDFPAEIAGTYIYLKTEANGGGGSVLPSSITPSSITNGTFLYGVSLNN